MPRKQKKYHYIYKTTCQVTGKFYVGMHSTDNLDDGYLGSGKILGYSIGKHGRENHRKEILEFCETRDDLKKREAEVVNEELLANPLCINLKYGGEGGWDHLSYRNTSPEFAEWRQWRASLIPRDACSKGGKIAGKQNLVNAHLAGKIRHDTFRGRCHSEETLDKMRMSHKGKHVGEKNSQFGTCWVTNGTPIKIKKEELDAYLATGYRRGRK